MSCAGQPGSAWSLLDTWVFVHKHAISVSDGSATDLRAWPPLQSFLRTLPLTPFPGRLFDDTEQRWMSTDTFAPDHLWFRVFTWLFIPLTASNLNLPRFLKYSHRQTDIVGIGCPSVDTSTGRLNSGSNDFVVDFLLLTKVSMGGAQILTLLTMIKSVELTVRPIFSERLEIQAAGFDKHIDFDLNRDLWFSRDAYASCLLCVAAFEFLRNRSPLETHQSSQTRPRLWMQNQAWACTGLYHPILPSLDAQAVRIPAFVEQHVKPAYEQHLFFIAISFFQLTDG